jgi:hypothetical protein
MTSAVAATTGNAFGEFPFPTRIFAVPYVRNPASVRVLEKAGSVREGILRKSAIEDGEILDQAMYARIRSWVAARLSRSPRAAPTTDAAPSPAGSKTPSPRGSVYSR